MKPKFTHNERIWFGRYRKQLASYERLHPEEQALNAGLRYVVKMGFRMRGFGLELPDLVSAGNEGLARALKNYDPARGVPFLSYAHSYIHGAICHEIKRYQPFETLSPIEEEEEVEED